MTTLLHDCFVSGKTGFLLENPMARLPDYFEPWNRLAAEMPHLVSEGTMRQHVLQMVQLDWTQLRGHRQKRLAHLQLTFIASGYIWQDGEEQAAKVLPACVAVPLCGVSKDLGLMPILNHADLVLPNYTPTDPANNMSALYCLPGGKEAEWFVTVTASIELAFADGIKSVLSALEGVRNGDERIVTDSLVHLTQVVNNMQNILSRMHENLSASTFFNKLRPFLGGWGGEDNPLPDGLIYGGVSDQPVHAIGGSAAQSGTIQVLDALMGVSHSAEKTAFLLTMRSYMAPGHQRFIEGIESQSQGLQHMVKSSSNQELNHAYNKLLFAVVHFRSYHIQIVTKYIVQAASQAKQAENKFDSLDNKGTGGTDLLPFLKELRQDTRDQMATTSPVVHGTH
ncbi:hypothetical protein ACOMHN_062020 [Nucella lapillus]